VLHRCILFGNDCEVFLLVVLDHKLNDGLSVDRKILTTCSIEKFFNEIARYEVETNASTSLWTLADSQLHSDGKLISGMETPTCVEGSATIKSQILF
jgi:hypothetical protein